MHVLKIGRLTDCRLFFPEQVDVRALKQTLWQSIEDLQDSQDQSIDGLSFQQVLAGLTEENVVGNMSDLSVHLCFICVLHLANENGLRITGKPTLDAMDISNIPTVSTI